MATEYQKLLIKMETSTGDDTKPATVSGEGQLFVSGSGTAARMYHLDGNGDKGTVLTNEIISGDATISAAGALTVAANAVEGSMINSNAAGDGLAYASNAIKVDLGDLSANAVAVGADSIAIIDGGDDSSGKESIADLMTAVAGSGLEASSGVLAWYPDEVSETAIDGNSDKILFLDADDSSNPKKEGVVDFADALARSNNTYSKWANAAGNAYVYGMKVHNNDGLQIGDGAASSFMISASSPFVSGAHPAFYLSSSTAENTDTGRYSIFGFKGTKADGTNHTLGQIFGAHSGTGDDLKGKMAFYVNDGDDTSSLQGALLLDYDKSATLYGDVSINGTTAASSATTGALTVAGGVGVAADLYVGDDLTLITDSSVLSFGVGGDVTFTHDGGTGMDIVSAGALDISSTAGGATFTVVDGQTLTLGKSGASALLLSPHGTAGSELASLTNTAGTTDGTDGAGAILMSSVAGGMSLAWADAKDLWAEGGSMMFVANENKASCIQLHADAGSSQTIHIVNDAGTSVTEGAAAIQLLATAGGVNIKGNKDAADAILLTSDGGTSGAIKVHNDQGTAATSIELVSDAGGVSILSGNTTHGVKIATGTSGVPITLGNGTSEVTVADNLTVSGNLTVTGTTVTDSVEVISTSTGVIFEGGTDDGHEGTLISAVAGADVTYTLPNLTGHVPLLAGAASNANVTAAEFALLDGASSVGTTAVADGDGIVTNDGGVMKHTTVQTFQTYFDANSVGGTSMVSVGALDAGSITTGFGNIDIGASSLAAGSLDLSEGNLTNAGSIACDTLTTDDATNLAITAPALAITATTSTTLTTPAFSIESSTSDKPDVTIKNTNADAEGATLMFHKDTSASQADGDEIGGILFKGEDDGNNAQLYGKMEVKSTDVSAGAEQGEMAFYVAQYDGTLTNGLEMKGLGSDGNITVDIKTHDGSAGGLMLAGTLVTKTAAQINALVSTAAANTFTEDQIFGGTTPTLTIGDGGSEDTMLVFDGSGTDVRIGLDEGTDKLEIGTGTAHGTTIAMTVDTSQQVAIVATTAASSTTTGALTVAGGASVAADLFVGDDLYLASDSSVIHFGQNSDIVLTHAADYGLHLSQNTDAASEPTLTLETVGDHANGPIIDFKLDNGAGEADDDQLGQIRFYGDDSGNAATLYAHIKAVSEDITDGTEDGSLTFTALGAGSEKVMVYGNGAGLVLLNDSTYGTVKAHSFVTYSDETLKTNVKPLTNALEAVKKLKGYNYDWKSDGSSDIGFIAQEVEKVVPQVVYSKDGEAGSYGLDYASLTALLAEAIKQQDNEITTLKATLSSVLSSQEELLKKFGVVFKK